MAASAFGRPASQLLPLYDSASDDRRRDRQSLASAISDVIAMNSTDEKNTQRGRLWSMIQPPISGPTVPPMLKPVVTMPNTRPNAPGGDAARTSMSRDGEIMPDRNPAVPIATTRRTEPRSMVPTSRISTRRAAEAEAPPHRRAAWSGPRSRRRPARRSPTRTGRPTAPGSPTTARCHRP